MAEPFKDIVVEKFTASEADQDSEKPELFHFQFLFSQSAPELWVQIARDEIGCTRRVEIHPDRILYKCTPQQAQGVKDNLNTQVLPGVNQEYRGEAAAARARQDAENARQKQIFSEVEKAIRDQK